MEIILIIFLVLLALVILFSIFLLVKWMLNNKTRRIITVSFLAVVVMANISHHMFFKKMKFIPSKVYPELYLIKNPIRDREALNTIIKNKVVQNINNGMMAREESTISAINDPMRFYQYTKGWGAHPIGSAGTAHFINNEEDPGGFSSELLMDYQKQLLASFRWQHCQKDADDYFGLLTYFENEKIIKLDTLIHNCRQHK